MSFDTICANCGAPSGPSVGVCPYCKSVTTASKRTPASTTLTAIRTAYNEGDLARALEMAIAAEKKDLEKHHGNEQAGLHANANFILLYAKILFEAEAPSSRLKSFLARAALLHPEIPEINEWLELALAKGQLQHGRDDVGETTLKNILRRSPRNGHAAFCLGSHLYWEEKSSSEALPYLEIAVRECPNFLRAHACLAHAYAKIGAIPQAKALLRKCVALERNQNMKAFFKSELEKLSQMI